MKLAEVAAERIERVAAELRERLVLELSPRGSWQGELSESALSTATAVAALALADRHVYAERIAKGLAWLASRANPDGGWGDTVRSQSNISTTLLAWASFGAAGDLAAGCEGALRAAEAWLRREAGGVEAEAIAEAVLERYGKDKTFSAPILAFLAACGRLGAGPGAWRHSVQLPFELAALPRRWFGILRLPVVSYAIPALVAIGLARHRNLPSRNPVLRWARRMAAPRAVRVLEEIQPSAGGFLEAVPLTSFVAIGLAVAGLAQHAVARRCIEFLLRAQRASGAWPIDENLATWLTTLSVNALSAQPDGLSVLGEAERARILEWLLSQQHLEVHPYTLAPTGGWAWTDLPGGVPDADDTAGAILALRNLAPSDDRARETAFRGAGFLLRLQNRDGGVPTFSRGWGYLPFDQSAPDLTAHALRALAAWRDEFAGDLRRRIERFARRAVRYLAGAQRGDGTWVPLWFGNELAPGEENPTYGTSRALLGLASASARFGLDAAEARRRGIAWLLRAQSPDGGWGGAIGVPPSCEETALALEALAVAGDAASPEVSEALGRGAVWLAERALDAQPSPIGLYFARLWYFEKLYPAIFSAGALGALLRRLRGLGR